MKKIITLALGLMMSAAAFAQNNVGVNTTSPDASAALDVTSTTQGMLTPRMTASQRGAIASPATGLLVYQTDGVKGFYYYNGSAWTTMGASSSGPSLQLLASKNTAQTLSLAPGNSASAPVTDVVTFESVSSNSTLTTYKWQYLDE